MSKQIGWAVPIHSVSGPIKRLREAVTAGPSGLYFARIARCETPHEAVEVSATWDSSDELMLGLIARELGSKWQVKPLEQDTKL